MKLSKLGLVIAGLCATVAPASSFEPSVSVLGSKYTIGISGFVPVVCRAKIESNLIAQTAGTVSLGTLNEFCNSPTGYRVMADYSPALTNAKLLVDGREIALDQPGSVTVSQSDQAAIVNRAVELELAQEGQTGALSFRIEPN